ncbi:MAG: biopolymer transporter ExbD [Treponema sp.]|nr:biopolymer transporter ExbD [Treponema sp.]
MSDFFKKLSQHSDGFQINLTNMIDVIFILLIFFMVSTQFRKSTIPIDLPESGENVSAEEKNETVNLSANENEMQLEGETVTLENLQEKLESIASEKKEFTLVFSGDRKLSYESFLKIYAKIENSGITRIAIEHD